MIRVVGGGFAVDRHGFRDDSPFVVTGGQLPSGGPSPLLLVADPVESAPGTSAIAHDIVTGMDIYLRHAMHRGVPQALNAAFRAANQRAHAENRSRHGMRRIYLGLSCVVLQADELFVAQTSPSQVLVWQGGRAHAIPSLSTWSADEITETFSDLSYPLGFRETIEPRISYSTCAAGDVIAVVSWPLAKHLGALDSINGVQSAGDFAALLSCLELEPRGREYHGAVFAFDPSATMHVADQRLRHRTRQSLDSFRLPLDAQVANSESGGTHRSQSKMSERRRTDDTMANLEDWRQNGSGTRRRFDTLDSGQSRWTGTDAFPTLEIGDNGDRQPGFFDLAPPPRRFSAAYPREVATNEHSNTIAGRRARRRAARPARRGWLVELFAGLLLSLTAAVVGVWQVTKRDRPIHGPRDDGTLGLPHLQRWADTYQPPRFEGIRSVTPRFQLSGIAIIAIGLTIVMLLGVLAYSQVTGRVEERAAGVDERLREIAAVRVQAETSPDDQAAYASLIEAETVLETMATSVTGDDLLRRIDDEQRAVGQTLDSLMAVERLTSVQTMGSLPASPDGVTPRLFGNDGRVFVLTDGLYELDRTTGSLILLLAPDEVVGGSPVGTLLAADWSEDRPLVVDSHNAFTLDPSTGNWDRQPLGTLSAEGYSDIAAIASFDRNLYVLSPESGQILKFDSLDFGEQPDDWTAGVAKDELRQGADLVVDGSIHVALADGQLLSFFRSALESTVMTGVVPPVSAVSALMAGSDGQVFYLIDESDGRIVCVDREGNVLRQFIVAAGAPPLIGATDIVVNESSGIAHVIANNTLYAVRLEMPSE